MAFFGATIETVAQATQHPNADRLDIISLTGLEFQFVTVKNKLHIGDQVVYFPIDAILPPKLLQAIGLEGKLAGANKDRIKTIKLRDAISQGLVATFEEVKPLLYNELFTRLKNATPEELTTALGVTKYDPEPNIIQNGNLQPLPAGASIYDIEGADRYPEVLELLMHKEVQITEKVEGSNFSCTISPRGQVFVNMRRNTIIPLEVGEKHHFWSTAKNIGLLDNLTAIQSCVWEHPKFKNLNISIYGEILGPKIQGNIYKLKDFEVQFFDIKTDRGFLPVDDMLNIFTTFGLKSVPEIAYGTTLSKWLNGKTLKDASNGKSLILASILREGIVIKPFEEQTWGHGRLIIKQRSPEYLAKEKT